MEVHGKMPETNVRESVNEHGKDCEPCKIDNTTSRASGLCRECREYMCNPCFQSHLKLRSCRQHILVDSDVSSSLPFPRSEDDEVKCNKHTAETIRFYCRKHEVVGCGDCMVLEHNACKSEYIKNVSEDVQQNEEFKTIISKIEKLTSENKENEEAIHEKRKDNSRMLETALDNIRHFRTDINKYLDELEANFTSEAKEIMSENEKLLSELEQKCKLFSSKIEKIKEMINTEVYKDTLLFINIVASKPNVSDTEHAIAEVTSNQIKTFDFVYDDEQLRNTITETNKLGTMNISTAFIRHDASHQSDEDKENMDKKTEVSSTEVAVGTRVRYNRRLWIFGRNTGTVSAVNTDGTVDVQWDGGKTDGPYTVGAAGDVTII